MAALLAASGAAQAESYFCESEMSGGLFYDKQSKKWTAGTSSYPMKYVVRRATAQEREKLKSTKAAWVVSLHGEKNPTYTCLDFGGIEGNELYCDGLGGQFKVNRANMRFLSSYSYGYWWWDPALTKEGDDTPHVAAGRCSRIE